MAIRKVILTEAELTRLIKNIVTETKAEMEEGWLEDKLGGVGKGLENIGKGARRFATGHSSKGERDEKMNQFFSDLDEVAEMVMENPEDYYGGTNWERMKARLEREAEENNYKGELIVMYKTPPHVIKYEKGYTGLEHMGSAAGAGMRSSHTFGSGGKGGSLG
jgi:hypothetical protein